MRKRISLLVSTLALVALASVAQGATRFAVQDANSVDTFTVQDTGRIGIGLGATLPGSGIHIQGPALQDPQIYLAHTASASTNNGGGGILMHYNGPAGALPNSGDRLGYILFGAMDGVNRRNVGGVKAIADGAWVTNVSTPTAFAFETSAPNQVGVRTERMRIDSNGNVGIGTTAAKSKLHVVGLPTYADNAAALAGGLTAGAFYKTSTGVLMVVF